MKSTYYIYILACVDGSLYTGIATDVERRLTEHNSSVNGAKYTKSRRPVSLVYQEKCKNRSEALKREYEIKQLSRQQKLTLIKDIKV